MTKLNNKKMTMLTTITSTLAISMLALSVAPQASASHNGEPTMWVNGINAGQAHSYIYNVPPGAVDIDVALMIKDMQEKSIVTLSITDPGGATTICPYTPAGFNLLVAECVISFPPPGIWTVTITAGATTSNPVGYAIAADTI